MSTLSINCFVLGGNPSEVFTLEILETESVSILKALIKEERSTRLNHVDASDLTAWKVSLPMDTITPELTLDDVESCQKLYPVKKISSIFGEALVDEHVHILVQAPAGTLHNATNPHITPSKVTDPAQLPSLNCLLLRVDQKLNQIFTVEILETKNFSILKNLIKEKQSHRLNHVVASELILSQVSLPVDDDLEESLKNVDLTPLKPFLRLSQVFPRVEEDRLHIVVQVPNGEPISVFLHVTDNLIDVVQRTWVPKMKEKRRGEMRSLPCVKVRVFFLLLPSSINNI